MNKYEQTISKQYWWANQTHSNCGGPRNGNNRNTGNEKERKHNDPYISKEFWKKMAPEVRKSHIEASKKGRPYQQSYVFQYYDKGSVNDQKNHQRNQKMGGTRHVPGLGEKFCTGTGTEFVCSPYQILKKFGTGKLIRFFITLLFIIFSILIASTSLLLFYCLEYK